MDAKKVDFRTTYRSLFAIGILVFVVAFTIMGATPDTTAKNASVKPSPPAVTPPATKPQVAPPATTSSQTPVSMPNCKISEITDFKIDRIAPSDNVVRQKAATLTRNSEIMITITNPKDFLLSRPSDKTELILYADKFPLKGMNTEYFAEIGRQYLNDPSKCWPDKMQIPFVFTRDTSNENAWKSMFKLTKWYKNKITVDMSLGWAGMFPLNTSTNVTVNNTVTIVFYKIWEFWLFSGVYLIFIICVIVFCSRTGLIRDPDTVNNVPGPFSLAQTQLAFWTVIVIGGFGYLWILTGQADSLNSSILLLLGISSGTTGAASFIDYYKKTSMEKSVAGQAQPLADNVVIPAVVDPTSSTATSPPVTTPFVIPNTIKQHRNFIQDILSDGVNMSVQRAQTALWNLILGLYFLWYVVTNKAMPDFDNTLLVLAGVSSVLYVGSKGVENPQTTKLNPAA
jgi:hypothetical protein